MSKDKLIETITSLKSMERNNFYFLRRRINKENGKKTLGWILEDNLQNYISENKNFDILHNIRLSYENSVKN